jgi:hypothetical protein
LAAALQPKHSQTTNSCAPERTATRLADLTDQQRPAILPGESAGRSRRRPSHDAHCGARSYACGVPISRFLKGRIAKEEAVLIGDPRVEGWESVITFEDQRTAVAWRDQLRSMGVDASCVADHPLDRFGRGDIYLMVPPEQWSRASEIVDNLD